MLVYVQIIISWCLEIFFRLITVIKVYRWRVSLCIDCKESIIIHVRPGITIKPFECGIMLLHVKLPNLRCIIHTQRDSIAFQCTAYMLRYVPITFPQGMKNITWWCPIHFSLIWVYKFIWYEKSISFHS